MQIMSAKTEQLQVRVSPSQKRLLKELATKQGVTVSEYILSAAIPDVLQKFNDLVVEAFNSKDNSYVLAEISDFLSNASSKTLLRLSEIENRSGNNFIRTYISSMIHYACSKKNILPPRWVSEVSPLPDPYFGSSLLSLRPYLLTVSPPEFKSKNIYIDASIGDQI